MEIKIKQITGLKEITDIFLFGSRAYGLETKKSDYDFIVLANDAINGRQFSGHFNITIYTKEHFIEKLKENKPFAVEIFFLQDKAIKQTTKLVFIKKNFEFEFQKRKTEDFKKLENEISWFKKEKIKKFILRNDELLEKIRKMN